MLKPIKTLRELEAKAWADPAYHALALAAARNLGGGDVHDLRSAMRWLNLNADETNSERGVVDEVNFCRRIL